MLQSGNRSAATRPAKVVKAKVTARAPPGHAAGVRVGGSTVLSPPISSVVVERHQPVSKVCASLSASIMKRHQLVRHFDAGVTASGIAGSMSV